MSAATPLTLDVREDLRNGGEPLPAILQAVGQLESGQTLRLLATFEPIPLYAMLGRKGFGHAATRHGEGDWEILFAPGQEPTGKSRKTSNGADRTAVDTTDWPPATTFLDNRDLQPPEPLVRILDALEHLGAGEVLEAINEREPIFLYPELELRGAAIQVRKQEDGSVKLLIRRGG
ncbi:MAG: DUF2249 domain-containing protein [Acetobacteraceae bacterium]